MKLEEIDILLLRSGITATVVYMYCNKYE